VKALVAAAKEGGLIRSNLAVLPHTMRHTCATLLLKKGIDIYTVSKHLGHADISTTSVYLDNDEDLTGAFDQMGDEEAA
jgi:site-specific recombinase XerD